ncbi:MAG: Zn-ribbon domain-containing OB-fold protein [Actinobacteria bacterium]|nr:Zn-ribbon domain-containing OB-fold protein [Actinomycetota bacterium]
MEEIKDTFLHPAVPLDFQNNYRVGAYMQRYLDGFKEKKILGAKCSQCGRVVVPPRKYCGDCNLVMEEFVELPQEGTLENFTVGHVVLEKGQLNRAEAPYVIGMVKLDGASNALLARLQVAPADARTGMKVKAVWQDQVEGEYSDLDCFEPA